MLFCENTQFDFHLILVCFTSFVFYTPGRFKIYPVLQLYWLFEFISKLSRGCCIFYICFVLILLVYNSKKPREGMVVVMNNLLVGLRVIFYECDTVDLNQLFKRIISEIYRVSLLPFFNHLFRFIHYLTSFIYKLTFGFFL